jgi:hypothetical protein
MLILGFAGIGFMAHHRKNSRDLGSLEGTAAFNH